MHRPRELKARNRPIEPAHLTDHWLQLRETRDQRLAQLGLLDQLDTAAGTRHVVKPRLIIEAADRPDRYCRRHGGALAGAALEDELVGQMHWFTASLAAVRALCESSAISRRRPWSLMTTK